MFDRSDTLSTSARPIVWQTGKRFRQLCNVYMQAYPLWAVVVLIGFNKNIYNNIKKKFKPCIWDF
jgi:hypothetical protein